ncbi:MAG: glutathione peroxidase [Janthinobacterium lividum]
MTVFSRRSVLAGLGAATVAGLSAPSGLHAADAPAVAWGFTFPSIEGGTLDLSSFRGRVLLVANTASFCGYTPQYKGLEALHKEFSPQGLTVVGIPSNDFGQESDSNGKVKTFCEATFDVQFPMGGLSHVKGGDAAPFYRWVSDTRHWEPSWNFCKVLVGRDGNIRSTFSSNDLPDGDRMRSEIRGALEATV